jgi:hypothetical protein
VLRASVEDRRIDFRLVPADDKSQGAGDTAMPPKRTRKTSEAIAMRSAYKPASGKPKGKRR